MKKLWLIFYFIPYSLARTQNLQRGAIISRTMTGQVGLPRPTHWIRFSSEISLLTLSYLNSGNPEIFRQKNFAGRLGAEINAPNRVSGSLVEERNNVNIGVAGKKNERILQVIFQIK